MTKYFKTEYIFTAILFLFLVFLLIIRPIVGLADNGDFERIMYTVGIFHVSTDYNIKFFNYMTREFAIIPANAQLCYVSTHLIPVYLSVFVSSLFLHKFDIRFLSSLYIIILLLGMFLIFRYALNFRGVKKIFSAFIISVVVLDLGYTAYLNSLFGEAATFVFFILFIGLFFKYADMENLKVYHVILLASSFIFFAFSKAQNAILGIIFAFYFIRFIYLKEDLHYKRLVKVFLSVILIFSALLIVTVPPYIAKCNLYDSVFRGVMFNSKTPSEDLQKLNLSPKLASLMGISYFDSSKPINIESDFFKKEFYDKMSIGKVALFYVKNPDRLMRMLNDTASYSFQTNLGYLGNYEYADRNTKSKKAATFYWYSNFRQWALPGNFTFIFSFFLIFLLFLIWKYKRASNIHQKLRLELLFLIVLFGIIQFPLQAIGDGFNEIRKHLFLFDLCFDIMLCTTIIFVFGTVYDFIVLKMQKKHS